MRVLVVEDERRLASAVRRGLTAEGFVVDMAHDGVDGLHLAREGGYDAVVLDLMRPGLSGYQVCERLRADGNWVPVLILSANVHADTLRLARLTENLLLLARLDEQRLRRSPVDLADDGPGIPAEDTERAFGRFSRLDGSRSRDGAEEVSGSGLGLAMVRATAEAHGGSVALGDADPGLRATVRLPLPKAPPEGTPTYAP
jgi:signal transduction histidine kinase